MLAVISSIASFSHPVKEVQGGYARNVEYGGVVD